MKKLLKTSLLIIVGLLVVTSCNEETSLIQPELDLTRYEQLSKTLENDFNQVASQLRKSNSDFSDSRSVMNAAEVHYGKTSTEFTTFLNSFNNVSSSYGRANNELTAFQQQSVEGIVSALSDNSSLSEFQLFLDERFEYFSNQTLDANDKNFILTYIVSYKVSLDFVANNLDLFSPESTVNGRVQGWWSDWGKCAAGIVGGAGLGALGGAAAGSVIPVLGTLAGGIIGGISGGLSGAAAACSE